MNIKREFIITVLSLLLIGTGCKPTEKNYRAAYEIAQNKKAKVTSDAEGHKVQQDMHYTLKPAEGDSVWVSNEILRGKSLQKDSIAEVGMRGKCGVAVGVFRMETNARALAERMLVKYPSSCVATNGNDRWYSVVSVYPDSGKAVKGVLEFKKQNPDFSYIGLPGSPVLIRLN